MPDLSRAAISSASAAIGGTKSFIEPSTSSTGLASGPKLVADKSLQCPNCYRAILPDKHAVVIYLWDLAAPAGDLARRSANAPADRREGIRPACDQIRLVKASVSDRSHITASIGMYRTRDLARDQVFMVTRVRDVNFKR